MFCAIHSIYYFLICKFLVFGLEFNLLLEGKCKTMNKPIHDGFFLIKQKRYFLFFHLLVSILLSFIGIFLFLDSIFSWNSLIKISRFFGFARVFFALLIMLIYIPNCYTLVCDIFLPKVVFAYDNNGFYLRNGEFFIPWNDVLEVTILCIQASRYSSREIVALKFSNEDLFVRSLSVFGRFMYFVRKKIYDYGVWICFKATRGNPTEVFSLFVKKCPLFSLIFLLCRAIYGIYYFLICKTLAFRLEFTSLAKNEY